MIPQQTAPMPRPQLPNVDQLADALVRVAESATWPDGSRLIDLAPHVLRSRVAPELARSLSAFDDVDVLPPAARSDREE